jgi:hypothetical protein
MVGWELLVSNNVAAQQKSKSFSQDSIEVVYVPDFVIMTEQRKGDTTYVMKCYNKSNDLLANWQRFEEIAYVSVFENYIDKKNYYRDKNGVNQPLPVSSIIMRYDRLGINKWMRVAYKTRKYDQLMAEPTKVVRQDTVITSTGKRVYCAYKMTTPTH